MWSKKRSWFGLLFLAVGMLFVACSGAKQPVKASLFTYFEFDAPSFLKVIEKEAEKQGLVINAEPVAWAGMHPILQSRIAAGNVPDIIDLKGQDIFTYAPAGVLKDISNVADMSKVSSAVRSGLQYNGKDYGIPFNAIYQGVFYNRKLFNANNIKVPETYKELMDAAALLQSKGITPFAITLADPGMIGNNTMQFAMAEVFRDDPKWGDKLFAGQITFQTSPNYRSVFEHMKDIQKYTWKDAFAIDGNEAATRFVDGKAAMVITGTWMNKVYSMAADFDYGIFPFPGEKKGAKLLYEPDHTITFSAKTDARVVDTIAKLFIDSDTLTKAFLDEASSYSLLGYPATKQYPPDQDIERYRKNNEIIDVTIGNAQVKWPYQLEMAKIISEWLLNKKSLDAALAESTLYKDKLNTAK